MLRHETDIDLLLQKEANQHIYKNAEPSLKFVCVVGRGSIYLSELKNIIVTFLEPFRSNVGYHINCIAGAAGRNYGNRTV